MVGSEAGCVTGSWPCKKTKKMMRIELMLMWRVVGWVEDLAGEREEKEGEVRRCEGKVSLSFWLSRVGVGWRV